jgi:hypothetical protein
MAAITIIDRLNSQSMQITMAGKDPVCEYPVDRIQDAIDPALQVLEGTLYRLLLNIRVKDQFHPSNPKLMALLEQSNREKPLDAPVILVLQSKYDGNQGFSDCDSLLALAATHYIIFKIIDSPEAFFSTIQTESEKLAKEGRRPIGTLIVRGHGNPDSIQLGLGPTGQLKAHHFKPGCFEKLPPDCALLFDSCELAGKSSRRKKNIASIIADAAGTRSVRAVKKIFGECVYRYCPKHGIVIYPVRSSKMDDFFHPEELYFCSNTEVCSTFSCPARIAYQTQQSEKLVQQLIESGRIVPLAQ